MNTLLNSHSYQQFSGKILNWDIFDSEERYNNNFKNNLKLLEKNKWTERKFTYRFNNDGFRSNEFDSNKKSILFLGCSLTFGTGLPIEETYGYKVADNLGLEFYNLGLGGSSNDTAYRLSSYYIPRLNPKIVILANPEITRLELCNGQQIFYYRAQMKYYQIDSFYKKWISDDINSILNYQKNTLAIENLCLKNNIKFINFDAPKWFLEDFIEKDDYARDLIHPGVKTHYHVYKKLIDQIC
jgi:hypothetical protein